MTLQLQYIQFNHDSSHAVNDAINLRKNAKEFIEVPEWRQGKKNPEDSLAAYAIHNLEESPITIRVKFGHTFTEDMELSVRAIPIRSSSNVGRSDLLGEVKEKRIPVLKNTDSFLEWFELEHHHLLESGVGIHDIEWLWQYKEQATQPWANIETSRHKIFTILELPKAPWLQAPYNSDNMHLPWTDALETACEWATGKRTLDEAASMVTQKVYSLGEGERPVLMYDCPGGGRSHYVIMQYFDCTDFLNRIKGELGNGPYVNCTDCATIVSTFSNLLGCDLWQSQMGNNFPLNPIRAIGTNNWEGCRFGGFSYHEVAWKNNCSVEDALFDACLQVDGDSVPALEPHKAELPMNIPFGDSQDQQYLFHLVPEQGHSQCKPLPETRVRRHLLIEEGDNHDQPERTVFEESVLL